MAIRQLSEEQIRTWTLEQKDRWWLANVWRGDMPQLTLRSGLTGMFLGGVLSLTNLYVGAKTGWTLGVGITSVILAFAMFKLLSAVGLGREFTLLENNAMQSIATAAGYMTAPMISSLAAYMMVTGQVIPMMHDPDLDYRHCPARRAVRLPAQTPLHQRRAASFPRGPRGRDRDGRPAHRRRGERACSRPSCWW